MKRIGIGGSVVDGSSPFSAALGSKTGSVAVKSRAIPKGAVSDESSCEENGNTMRDVSSNSRAFQALGPDDSLQLITPTSVLAVQPMKMRCLVLAHARKAAV